MNLLVEKKGFVVACNLVRDFKAAHKVFSDEICNYSTSGILQRGGFDLLCDILGGGDDPDISVRSGSDRSD